MPFSKDFPTFQDWLKAHPENTPYNRRIVSEHKKYPRATLSQLRGHPGKKRKPVSKLKPKKERKKPKKMQIIVSGNAVTDDRSHTAANVYSEFYIRSNRSDTEIADEIFQYLNYKGIHIYTPEMDENFTGVTVNFRENVPKGGKIMPIKKAKEMIYNGIEKELHPAGPHSKPGKSHHAPDEYIRRKEQRRKAREEKRRRYDNNEF